MTPRRVVVAAAALVVVLTVLVGARWHPLLLLDRHADADVNGWIRAHPSVLSVVRGVTHLGDPLTVTIGAVVAAVVLFARGARLPAAYMLLVRAAAVVTGAAVKEAVRRHRPVLSHPVAHAAGFSYPSGHALGSAAFYASLTIACVRFVPRPLAIVLAVLVPAAVALTRVALGVHYPSDVAAGLLLGWSLAIVARPVARGALAWPRREGERQTNGSG